VWEQSVQENLKDNEKIKQQVRNLGHCTSQRLVNCKNRLLVTASETLGFTMLLAPGWDERTKHVQFLVRKPLARPPEG
jgi:hypothetical protein